MKLTWPIGKQIRFDFYPEKADNLNDIPFVITPSPAYGVANDSVGIICRWRINAMNKENDEILGFLYDSETTIVEFGTKDTAMIAITKFAQDSFTNVEMAFQEKLRLPYNVFGKTRPSFDKIAQSVLIQLVDGGYYN